MKYLLILSLLSFSFAVKSQCCPYIDSIEIIPSSPTTTDNVKIVTTVTTPSQGMFISSNHSINGNIIDIDACYYSGLLPATQTYYDTLDIGILPAGTYDVNFTAFQSYDTICTYSDSTELNESFTVTEETNVITPVPHQTGRIYPNPSNGKFKINPSEETNPTHIRIHSISGEIVHAGVFSNEMNLDLDSGTYFIELLENELTIGYCRLVIKSLL